MLSAGFCFLRSQSFRSPLKQSISSSTTVLRARKKKLDEFSFQDDMFISQKGSKKTSTYKPKSDNQKTYVDYLQNKKIPVETENRIFDRNPINRSCCIPLSEHSNYF